MNIKKSKSVFLAIETSGRIGSVAAGISAEPLTEITFSGHMRHSAELFGSVEQVLRQIDKKIDDVGFIGIAAGPGSFTGIRIAVTMAKMMSFAKGTKIIAANTMDVIAANATEYNNNKNAKISRIATILDAKRKQFYVSIFGRNSDHWVKSGQDCLMKASQFVERFGHEKDQIWLLGEGLVYYEEDFIADRVRFLDKEYWPAKARNVYLVGRRMANNADFTDPSTLVPFYLRKPEAVVKRVK